MTSQYTKKALFDLGLKRNYKEVNYPNKWFQNEKKNTILKPIDFSIHSLYIYIYLILEFYYF